MLDLIGALRTVRDALEAGGVAATLDTAQIRTPGVWVTAESISLDLLAADSGSIAVRLVLVVPDLDDERAWEGLGLLLTEVDEALAAADLSPGGDITVENIILPNSSTPLPALGVPVDVVVTPDPA